MEIEQHEAFLETVKFFSLRLAVNVESLRAANMLNVGHYLDSLNGLGLAVALESLCALLSMKIPRKAMQFDVVLYSLQLSPLCELK